MFIRFKKNKRYITTVFIAVLVMFFVFGVPIEARADVMDVVDFFTFGNVSRAIDATFEGIQESFTLSVIKLMSVVLSGFSLLLGLAAYFLELTIQYTIVQMRFFVDGIHSIDLAWRTIRDVANIVFVFILLFISINIILGSWGSGSYNKSLIPKVIIAALLINFSLFFTKVVIDVSNIVTYEFYNSAKNIRGDVEPIVLEGGIEIDTGLTSAIMGGLGLSHIVNLPMAGQSPGFWIFFLLLSMILVLTATFVLFSVAFLLIMRFIVFLFLMITSPIAFLGELLPQLKPQAARWKETLSAQATFAPIFFVLILIVVLIINDPQFKVVLYQVTRGTGASTSSTLIRALVAIIFQFVVVIGLLTTALVTAKKTSGFAGNAFVKFGEKLSRGLSFGVVSGVGRSSRWVGSKAVGAAGALAGVAAREGIGRGASVIGKKYDSLIANIPKDTYDKWNKFGVVGALDRGVRQKIRGVEDAKFGTGASRADIKKAETGRARDLAQITREKEQQQAIDAGLKATEEAIKNNTYDSNAVPEIKEFMSQVSKMTDKELEKLLEDRLDLLKSHDFAAALTSRQMDAIKKFENLSPQDKSAVSKAREDGMRTRLNAADNSGTLDQEVGKITSGKPKDVAKLPAEVLKDPRIAVQLTPAILNQIALEDTLSQADRDVLRNIIENAARTPGSTNKITQASADWLNNPAGAGAMF